MNNKGIGAIFPAVLAFICVSIGAMVYQSHHVTDEEWALRYMVESHQADRNNCRVAWILPKQALVIQTLRGIMENPTHVSKADIESSIHWVGIMRDTHIISLNGFRGVTMNSSPHHDQLWIERYGHVIETLEKYL